MYNLLPFTFSYRTFSSFLNRQFVRILIITHIFYAVFPSWAWAARHHNESFLIELRPQEVEGIKHNSSPPLLSPPNLKISYHHETGQKQNQEWSWNLAEISKETHVLPKSEWFIHNTPTGIMLAWQGSKTSMLEFRINSTGDMFLERIKGCFQVNVCSSHNVTFGSAYYEKLQDELYSHGVSIKAHNINQDCSLNVHDLALYADENLTQGDKATLGIMNSAKLYGLRLYLKGHLMADDAQVELEGKDVQVHGSVDNESIFKDASLKVTAETLDQKQPLKTSKAHFKSEKAHFHGPLSSDQEVTFEIGLSLITDEPLKARSIKATSHFLQAKAIWKVEEKLRARAYQFDGTKWFSGRIVDLQCPTMDYQPSSMPCSALSLKGKSVSISDALLCSSLYLQGSPFFPKGTGIFAYLQDLTLDLDQGCHWNQPLSLPGFLKIILGRNATEPFTLKSPLRANKGVTLKSHSQPIILDQKEGVDDPNFCGSCESAQGCISIIAPSLTIHKGHIVSQDKLLIRVLKLSSQGRIHSSTLLEAICEYLETQEAITSDDTLILEAGTILYGIDHILAKNLVHLKLKQGGILSVPLNAPGILKVEMLPGAKKPLTILTELLGQKGLELICPPQSKLILGAVDGSKAVLKSSQGQITMEGGILNFLHGEINGYKGIVARVKAKVIHGLERGKEKTTIRHVSYAGISNGRSMSGSAKVPWLEYSPCKWRSDAGSMSINAPWIEFNGGSIWALGLTCAAPLSSLHPSAVIYHGVTLDILGDHVINGQTFYHGPCLYPFAHHYRTLEEAGRGGVKVLFNNVNHHIPVSNHSTLSVDGKLVMRIQNGRCVGDSTISAKDIIVGKKQYSSLRQFRDDDDKDGTKLKNFSVEGLLSNMTIDGQPLYTQSGGPIISARGKVQLENAGIVGNQGTISAPYIRIPFTQLDNGSAESALVPVKVPEHNVGSSLIDHFTGQGGADCCTTGPYVMAPMLLPSTIEENLAPRVFITPQGFMSFPANLRPLCDPLTESRLVIQNLIKRTGLNYLPGYESLTPWQTYALIRKLSFELAQPWLAVEGSQNEQTALIPRVSQRPAYLIKALTDVTHPLLCYQASDYTSSSIAHEQAGDPQLFFPSQNQQRVHRPGPGVITGTLVALEGTPSATIRNQGLIHADNRGLLTGYSLNQVKILDYARGPALAIEDYRGREIIRPTLYQLRWGGDFTGGTWEWHLHHMSNTLGMVHVDNLWADLYSHYNSGRVVVDNLCIWDVGYTHQERLQRSWNVTTYHERIKKTWWGDRDVTSWTETHTCSESYPAPLSGYFHAGTLRSGPEAKINEIFPQREVPLAPTMESYLLHGGNINTGEGGMSMVVSNYLETIPKVDTYLQPYSISRRGTFRKSFESGAVRHHSILVPAMVSEGDLQWSSQNTMSLQALHAKVTGQNKILSFKAQGGICFPDFKVWQDEIPYFEKKGRATYLIRPSREIGVVSTCENPHGHTEITSGEFITGIQPYINSLTKKIDAPTIELYRQILRQEFQIELIDTGQLLPDAALVVVALAIAIATQGMGAALLNGISSSLFGTVNVAATATAAATVAPAISLTATGAVMASAAFTSACTQLATSILRDGDPLNAVKSLCSGQGLRSLGTSVATAGLMGDASTSFEGFAQRLMMNGLQSVVKASVSSLIERRDFGDALKDAGIDALVSSISASITEKIGEAASAKANPLTPIEHKLAHFAVGAGMGAVLDRDNPFAGGLTGGAGAVIGEVVAESLVDREQLMREANLEAQRKGRPEEASNIYRDKLNRYVNIGRLVAGSVIAVTGRDPSIAIATATNALENNFAKTIPLSDVAQTSDANLQDEKAEDEEDPELAKKLLKAKENEKSKGKGKEKASTRLKDEFAEDAGESYLKISGLQEEFLHDSLDNPQRLYFEMAGEDKPYSTRSAGHVRLDPIQREVQQKYDERMEQIFNADVDDGLYRSYTATGAMVEAQLRAEYEKKGLSIRNEATLREIFSYHRPPTPPRTDKACIEGTKVALKKAVPQWIKAPIKAGLKGVEQGARYVYGHLPEGGQKTAKITLGLIGHMADAAPTAVRRGLRDAGVSAWLAQDVGDSLSLIRDFAPLAGVTVKAAKTIHLTRGSKAAAGATVEALDLARVTAFRMQGAANVSASILQKVNLRGETAITDRIFSFARNEQGSGKGFGRTIKATAKGFPKPLSLQYEVKDYLAPQRVGLESSHPHTKIGNVSSNASELVKHHKLREWAIRQLSEGNYVNQHFALGILDAELGLGLKFNPNPLDVGFSFKKIKGKHQLMLKETSLHGENIHHVQPQRDKLNVHTELLSVMPEQGAHNLFERITGQKLSVGTERCDIKLPDGKVVYFRHANQSKSGHYKVEITTPGTDTTQKIIEKVTFKQKELKTIFEDKL